MSLGEGLWHNYLGESFNILRYFLYLISFIIFYSLSITYIIRQKLWIQCTRGHWARFLLYTCLLTALLLYGFLRGNTPRLIAHEMIVLYSLGIFLIVGTDDKVCRSIIKYSTVVFWAAFILSAFTYDIRVNEADLNLFASGADNQGRYVDSVAYMFFRPFISLGLPLFIYGWLEKNRRWHYLQILALVGYIVINVMIFKFRGALVLAGLVGAAAILMHTSITRKIKLILLAMAAIIVVFGWIGTKEGSLFTKRAKKFDTTNKAIEYRLPESERYFKVMGYEWLWGRGLGGTFKYNNTDWGRNRGGVHIGWVTFTLKGGLPLLIIMLSSFGSWIGKKRKLDPYHTVAWFWIPIAFVDWLVNPIALNVPYMLGYGLTFLLMARFGKRPLLAEQPFVARGPEIPQRLQNLAESRNCYQPS